MGVAAPPSNVISPCDAPPTALALAEPLTATPTMMASFERESRTMCEGSPGRSIEDRPEQLFVRLLCLERGSNPVSSATGCCGGCCCCGGGCGSSCAVEWTAGGGGGGGGGGDCDCDGSSAGCGAAELGAKGPHVVNSAAARATGGTAGVATLAAASGGRAAGEWGKRAVGPRGELATSSPSRASNSSCEEP